MNEERKEMLEETQMSFDELKKYVEGLGYDLAQDDNNLILYDETKEQLGVWSTSVPIETLEKEVKEVIKLDILKKYIKNKGYELKYDDFFLIIYDEKMGKKTKIYTSLSIKTPIDILKEKFEKIIDEYEKKRKEKE